MRDDDVTSCYNNNVLTTSAQRTFPTFDAATITKNVFTPFTNRIIVLVCIGKHLEPLAHSIPKMPCWILHADILIPLNKSCNCPKFMPWAWRTRNRTARSKRIILFRFDRLAILLSIIILTDRTRPKDAFAHAFAHAYPPRLSTTIQQQNLFWALLLLRRRTWIKLKMKLGRKRWLKSLFATCYYMAGAGTVQYEHFLSFGTAKFIVRHNYRSCVTMKDLRSKLYICNTEIVKLNISWFSKFSWNL